MKKGKGNGGKTASLLKVEAPQSPEPPKCGALDGRQVQETDFRRFYNRGDFPVATIHGPAYNRINWKNCQVDQLEYFHYLPIFFEGIREK